MADLYTSLVRAKQELNGGVLPPMTPAPRDAQDVLDPEFCIRAVDGRSIGLGGIVEDEARGLRCPVRGCGTWHHRLKQHLDTKHRAIGGSQGVKRMLGISLTATLDSTRLSERRSKYMAAKWARGEMPRVGVASGSVRSPMEREPARRRALRATKQSIGQRNLLNTCPAQIANRILAIQERLGRSPTVLEARQMDPGLTKAVDRLYGSWNAAKAMLGFKLLKPRAHGKREYGKEYVLTMLGAWYEAHGSLPTIREAKNPTRTPLIPSAGAVLKHMGTHKWDEAMRRVATALGIRGGRYGLPDRTEHSEAAD